MEKTLRYLIAGGLAFTAEYSSFLVLFYFLAESATVSNSISFLVGLTLSFLINKLWTFSDREQIRRNSSQITMYLGLALVNLLITNVTIGTLISNGVPGFVAKIILVAVVTLWNFVLLKKVIFK